MIAEWNHGLKHPEDCLVVPQQIFAERNVFFYFPLLQESFNMFVKPGFVPFGHIVNLGFLNIDLLP